MRKAEIILEIKDKTILMKTTEKNIHGRYTKLVNKMVNGSEIFFFFFFFFEISFMIGIFVNVSNHIFSQKGNDS